MISRLKLAAATGIVAGLGAVVAPGVASAASAELYGTVCTCGTWTTYDNVRTKAGYGNIVLGLTNKTYGTTYIALARSDGSRFSNVTSYTSLTTKTLATNVLNGTQFRMQARMDDWSGWGADNNWGGLLSY